MGQRGVGFTGGDLLTNTLNLIWGLKSFILVILAVLFASYLLGVLYRAVDPNASKEEIKNLDKNKAKIDRMWASGEMTTGQYVQKLKKYEKVEKQRDQLRKEKREALEKYYRKGKIGKEQYETSLALLTPKQKINYEYFQREGQRHRKYYVDGNPRFDVYDLA